MTVLSNIATYFSTQFAGTDRIVFIPSDSMGEFSKGILSAQKRALKLKCEPIVANKVMKFITEKTITYIYNANTREETHRSYRVNVEMNAVAIGGGLPKMPGNYELLGIVEFTDSDALVKTVPGKEIPETYRAGVNHCDHCNKIRARNGAVIVRNTETNQTLQVGGQCVKDFLGASLNQFLAGFNFQSEYFVQNDNGEGGYGGTTRCNFPTMLYLECVCAAIRAMGGFIPTSEAKSTKEIAIKLMTNNGWIFCDGKEIDLTDADIEEAEYLVSKATEILTENRSLSDFEWNMKMGLSSDVFSQTNAGVLAAISKLVYGRKAREEKKAADPVSQHVGTKGDKLTLTVTYERSVSFDSQWGVTHIRMFKDAEGNTFVWKTGSAFYCKDVHMTEGTTMEIVGTVKGHDTYREVNQTVLTRVVVSRIVKLAA